MDGSTIEGRLAALEAEIASLRSQLAAATDRGGPDAPGHLTEAEPAGPTTSRRALLGGAVAGAAAAVTGVLVSAQPAAAGTGTMQYGGLNNAGSSGTGIVSSNGTATFSSTNNGAGAAVLAAGAGGTGLKATATGEGIAVYAASDQGEGLFAVSSHGFGAAVVSGSDAALVVGSPASHVRFDPKSRSAPSTDTILHFAGELICDKDAALWWCIQSGTPGTFVRVTGPGAAGAFQYLPAPVRIYDSRPGTSPSVGPKTPMAAAEVRTLDTSANGSGVPAGASGVVLTCMVVNAASGGGNFTVWADGVARPSANSMVWGGADGRHSTLAMSAVSSARKIRISSSLKTDVVVDVVGYYR